MAFILALEPFTHLQPISLHLRPIILSLAVFPLARLLADCDAELRWRHNRPPVCSCPWGGKRVESIGTTTLFRLKLNTPNPILVSFQPKISETASSNTPLTRY